MSDHDDGLNLARGCAVAIAVGVALWLVLAAVVLVIAR